ncbi:MAG: carbohydrate binding domain-containing protein [Candidatus Buchananbacteria bacterium]
MKQEHKNLTALISRLKKTVTTVVMCSMVFSTVMPALLYPLEAQAYPDLETQRESSGNAEEVIVEDVEVNDARGNNWLKSIFNNVGTFQTSVEGIAGSFQARDSLWKTLEDAVYTAGKSGLSYLLNTMAYDIATWLASGGQGQQPMFYTDGWGAYLTDLVDGAAGKFLESFSDDFLGFNLCNPSSFEFKLQLGLGIGKMTKPDKPDCTVTELVKNWQDFADDPDFLDKFDLVFDPEKNDLGIAVGMFGKYYEYQAKVREAGTKDREEGDGTKPVTSKFGKILTPHFLVSEEGRQMLAKGTITEEELDYGDIFMNALSNFINTLAGKLLQRIFKEGLAALRGTSSDTSSSGDKTNQALDLLEAGENLGRSLVDLFSKPQDQDLYSGDTGTTLFTSMQASKERYKGLLTAGTKETGPYDIMSKMLVCLDANNPGPEECVIDESFRSAIEKKYTLAQAIGEGLINGDAPFGYKASTIQDGMPYRSILILRAHRVVPVGWELAAKVAQEFYPSETWTLNKLMAEYDRTGSAFKGLVDKDWVLELPDHYCKAQGYGAKISSEKISSGKDSNKDGDYTDINDTPPVRQVVRDQYCADYQTCIQKANDGSCLYYGYCTEEKRIWDLQGTKCPSQYNTCTTFQKPTGEIASYLRNSIDYNGCNKDNAGCQWYCTEFNSVNNVWSCVNESEKVLKTCAGHDIDSATGVVGCRMTAACTVSSGQSFCYDTENSIKLDLSQPCASTSQWWKSTQNSCVINTGCTIARGGVNCQVTGCESKTNLLPNPSFENATSTTGDQSGVSYKWYGNLNYFRQAGSAQDQVKLGKNSIRFYNSGAAIAEGDNILTSENLTLKAATYTFSGYVYNTLNSGNIKIEIINASDALTGNSPAKIDVPTGLSKKWQPASIDFVVTSASQPVQIRITVENPSGQISGTAWFDSFKVSESCITSPITLTMVGNMEKDQSKLHLDRDAVACSEDDAGCSQLISLKAGAGTNLVQNGSFDDWSDFTSLPLGWQKGASWDSGNAFERASGVTGNYALKLTNGSQQNHWRDFETMPIIGMKPNTTYRISFWAKSNSADAATNLWYAEILSNFAPNNSYCSSDLTTACTLDNQASVCTGYNADDPTSNHCVVDYQVAVINGENNLKLTTNWQRFILDSITTRIAGYNFRLSFNNGSANATAIYIDGVQIEEVETRNPVASDYKDYGANNLVYLKKAPDALSCKGYTRTRPNPNILKDVNKDQCLGENMVWSKFCSGGDKAGQTCSTNTDCAGGGVCIADSCDASGAFCCHEVDPAECNKYAPYCQEDEVGCQLFTPTAKGNFTSVLPAVAAYTDYCPAECVGYDAFYQSKTFLERQESLDYFIPAKAKMCSADQAGCDEFTNLDEVQSGGESRQYYIHLRLCAKPAEPTANCQTFYTWQGSDEAGYQLKSFNLSASSSAPYIDAPKNVLAASDLPDAWCADKNLDASGNPACCNGSEDIANNPFCKEFYGTNGQIYYRIYENTVSCSNDCHPYRKTKLSSDDILNQQNCLSSLGSWDSTNNVCIYQAIPNQGITCSAQSAGCREYRGNAAGNVYTAFNENFEDGDIMGWGLGSISSEALSVGGHSIKSSSQVVQTATDKLTDDGATICTADLPACSDTITSACFIAGANKCLSKNKTCLINLNANYCSVINDKIKPNQTYLISFWAKSAANNATLKAQFINTQDTAKVRDLGSVKISSEWSYYLIGPIAGDKSDIISSRAALKFLLADSSAVDYYLDNIQIREVQNYIYAIKGSWTTPASCDTNPFLATPISAPQYMLGCKQYRDKTNLVHNLKSFSHLCREEVVGCEAMIDTYNSATPFAFSANEADALAKVTVPADKMTYIVNQADYQCNAQAKGCQKLGSPLTKINATNETYVSSFVDKFLINDPNKYNTILCGHNEVGCEEFQTNDGFAYFKDPRNNTCDYKLIPGKNVSAWFRSDTQSSTPDCPLVLPAVGEAHPGKGFAGNCPNDNNTCNLFIDPISDIAKNTVSNGDLSSDVDNNDIPDGWQQDGSKLVQSIWLKHQTLYTLSIDQKEKNRTDDAISIDLINCPGLSSFDSSVVTTANSALISTNIYQNDPRTSSDIANLPADRTYSGRFHVPVDQICKIRIIGTNLRSVARQYLNEVAIRETGEYYLLENTVDKLSCNGIVNQKSGCVLFNDRSQVNYHLGENDITYLSFDADVSGIDKTEKAINNGLAVSNNGQAIADSNSILKVVPDRTCAAWLYCSSYVNDTDDKNADKKYCSGLSLCQSADTNGNCLDFVNLNEGSERVSTYQDPEKIKNMSGFAQPGLSFGSQSVAIAGDYSFAEMKQVGAIGYSPSTNFESAGADLRPYGWDLECPLLTAPTVKEFKTNIWKQDYAKVIADAITAQQEGLPAAAPEGLNFFKLSGPYVVASEKIDVFANSEYTISAYINTQKLIKGQARIVIEQYDSQDNLIGIIGEAGDELSAMRLNSGQSWTFKVGQFQTNASTVSIRIKLENWNPDTGNRGTNPCSKQANQPVHKITGSAYFDDIKLKPSLEVGRDNANNNVFVPQGCRAYPESGSLSCDYYSTEGYHYQGWLGYCTLSDPANPSQCLMWWPVELIQGGFVTQEPLIAQQPLYYCLGAKESHYRYHACMFEDGNICASAKKAPSDKSARQRDFVWTPPESWNVQKWQIEKIAVISSISDCSATDQCGGAYGKFYFFANPDTKNEYISPSLGMRATLSFSSGDVLKSISFETTSANCICADADIEIETANSWCQYVTQTVTPYGQNKAWWDRIGNRSGQIFAAPGTGYLNLYDYPPFGALIPPYPSDDPSNWNLISGAWYQPLFVQKPQTDIYTDPFQVRAGLPASCSQLSDSSDNANCIYPTPANTTKNIVPTTLAQGKSSLQRLFAKSYNTWEFQGDGVCKDAAGSTKTAADNTPVECACPESLCGVDTSTNFKQCNNDGSICEVGFVDCVDWTTFVEAISSLVVEGSYTNAGVNGPALVATIVGKLVVQAVTACGPQACSSSADCGAGEGTCVPFIHYILIRAGITTDDTTLTDEILNILFGTILSAIGGSGSTDSATLADIIRNAISSGESNEDILEGKGGLLSQITGTASLLFAQELNNLLGSYCSQTALRCQSGSHSGDRCCFLSSCSDNVVTTYRCIGGPNKGMICDPTSSQDNCPSGTSCKVRTINQSYVPVETAWGNASIPSSLKTWKEPTRICEGNQRPDHKCQGGVNDGIACTGAADCPSGTCEPPIVCSNNNTKACVQDADCAGGFCNNDFCAIPPGIIGIKANGATGFDIPIYGGDYISLSFTVKVDPQQLPLTGYSIDWGDGNKTTLSGQALLSREDEKKPFVSSHIYSYWDLKAAEADGKLTCWAKVNGTGVSCCGTNTAQSPSEYCRVLPQVQIKDNWNWCNSSTVVHGSSDQAGYYGNNCSRADAWQPYGKINAVGDGTGEIIVYP